MAKNRAFGVAGLGCRGVALALALLAAAVATAATTQYEYDDLGRLTRAYDPAGAEITYTYDEAGNVLSRTVNNDLDGDGFENADDCDPADPDVHPGAPEINDGRDNQCPGDPGYGLVDEMGGRLEYATPGDKATLSWTPQVGATFYQLGRWGKKDLTDVCQSFWTPASSYSDPTNPSPGEAFFYLVRAWDPNRGSWGRSSSGERVITCP